MHQNKSIKNHFPLKDPIILPTGSTIAVQHEDGRPWTHGTITKHGNPAHYGQSYKVWILKTACIVTRIMRHIKKTLITAEQYIRHQLE